MCDECCFCGCDDDEQLEQPKSSATPAAAAAAQPKWQGRADEPQAPQLLPPPSKPILGPFSGWMTGFEGSYVISLRSPSPQVRWSNITAQFPGSYGSSFTDRSDAVAVGADAAGVYGVAGWITPAGAAGADLVLRWQSWDRLTGASLTASSSTVPIVRYVAPQPCGFGRADSGVDTAPWYSQAISPGGAYHVGDPSGRDVMQTESLICHQVSGAAVRVDVVSWSEFEFEPAGQPDYWRIRQETRRVALVATAMGADGPKQNILRASYVVPPMQSRENSLPWRGSFTPAGGPDGLTVAWFGGWKAISSAAVITDAPAAAAVPATRYMRALAAQDVNRAIVNLFSAIPETAPDVLQNVTVKALTKTSTGVTSGALATVVEPRVVTAPISAKWLDPNIFITSSAAQVGGSIQVRWDRGQFPQNTNSASGNIGWFDTPMHGTVVAAAGSKPMLKPGKAILPSGPLTFQVSEAGWYALGLMVESTVNQKRVYTLKWASAAGGGTLMASPPADIYTAVSGPAAVYLQPGTRSITPPAGSFHSAALVGICPG